MFDCVDAFARRADRHHFAGQQQIRVSLVLRAADASAQLIEIRETETIGYLLNYKTIDGFTMATSLLIKVGNAPPIHLKIDKFEYNFPVDEAMFHMPEIAESH